MTTPRRPDAEEETRSAYETGTIYETARICRRLSETSGEYTDRLLEEKFGVVSAHYKNGTLVDLCCANGSHLVDIADGIDDGIGIDFSGRYLTAARDLAAGRQLNNVAFVQADARRIPIVTDSVQFLYCFSALYAIPRAEEVVAEVGRVLAPGGCAVLDFGNRQSINAFVSRYYTDWPSLHPLTLGEIRQTLRRSGLSVVGHRRFQILPLWADRPSWLWPLLHPSWKGLLKRRLRGRMIDEWLSSLPILRRFAFRHLIVCRKVGGA